MEVPSNTSEPSSGNDEPESKRQKSTPCSTITMAGDNNEGVLAAAPVEHHRRCVDNWVLVDSPSSVPITSVPSLSAVVASVTTEVSAVCQAIRGLEENLTGLEENLTGLEENLTGFGGGVNYY